MKIFALLSRQGTACKETALCDGHFSPENRKMAYEAGCRNHVDPPISIVGWADCTDNDALSCIVCGEPKLPEEEIIDTSDIPEASENFFKNAKLRNP